MGRIILGVFGTCEDRGSTDGGKGFIVNLNVSKNLDGTNGTNWKLIYLKINLTIIV